jgi:hypothetical protein
MRGADEEFLAENGTSSADETLFSKPLLKWWVLD